MESLLMTADEVAKELNVSKNYAYKVIRRMKYFMMRVDYDTGKEGH